MNNNWRNRKSRGFTLVELMIVLAILAILFTFTAPFLSGGIIPKYKVDAAAKGLVTQMRLWRMKAIAKNTRIRVAFSGQTITAQSVDFDFATNTLVPNSIIPDETIVFGAKGDDYVDVDMGRTFATGKALYEIPAGTAPYKFNSPTPRTVVFRPNGMTNSSGVICILPQQYVGTTTIEGQKLNRAIHVSRAGLVTKYRYDVVDDWESY